MMRQIAPRVLDRLVDTLIYILQWLIDVWAWLATVLTLRTGVKQQSAGKTRGSRPAAPTTIGLVFAEPEEYEVSVQQAVQLAVWCA